MKKTKLIIASFFGLVGLSTLSYLFISRPTLIRDAGYLTRPIWDKKPEPWNITQHYYAEGIPAKDLCKLHNWTPRETSPKVFDAIIFSIELDLLEIRLRELWDVVDHFIILESDKTFTGSEKELTFAKHRDRFSWAEPKIIYRSYNDLKLLKKEEDPFTNEHKMREYMNNILEEVGVKVGDLLINADVDEIPYCHTIDLLRSCQGYPEELHLELRDYLYSFEFFRGTVGWGMNVNIYEPGKTIYHHGQWSNNLLTDAGWHCSFCFRYLSDFKFKMTSYSHSDRVTKEEQLKDEVIQEKICQGKDVFDMLPEAYTYKELINKWGSIPKSNSFVGLPKHLLKNKDSFSFLLPGGCVREINESSIILSDKVVSEESQVQEKSQPEFGKIINVTETLSA
jgi:beta-1,4-mannosyl-glycoprotein beta-1,4-N-acetylglucosaminyltransferase